MFCVLSLLCTNSHQSLGTTWMLFFFIGKRWCLWFRMHYCLWGSIEARSLAFLEVSKQWKLHTFFMTSLLYSLPYGAIADIYLQRCSPVLGGRPWTPPWGTHQEVFVIAVSFEHSWSQIRVKGQSQQPLNIWSAVSNHSSHRCKQTCQLSTLLSIYMLSMHEESIDDNQQVCQGTVSTIFTRGGENVGT